MLYSFQVALFDVALSQCFSMYLMLHDFDIKLFDVALFNVTLFDVALY